MHLLVILLEREFVQLITCGRDPSAEGRGLVERFKESATLLQGFSGVQDRL